MRVDCAGIQQLAGRIDHRHLAAGAETRVNPQHHLPGQRRLGKQRAQVGGKHGDGMRLGLLGQRAAHIALDGRQQQAFGGIYRRLLQLIKKGRALIGAEMHKNRFLPVALGHGHLYPQHLFFLAAVDRQHLVRAHPVDAELKAVV